MATPGHSSVKLVSLEKASRLVRKSNVDVAGVVIDILPPKMTRNSEYMFTITLCDQSRRMRARFFAKKESDLPSVRAVGEILLLSGIQLSVFHNETLLQSSTEDSGMLKWLLLRRPNTHPQTLCRPPVFGQQLTREDHAAMARLRAWYAATGGNAMGASSIPQSVTAAAIVPKRTEGRQFALVRDMKFGHFYDMVGKVVKTFNENLCVTVYVTDYTENKDLYKYDPQTIDPSFERNWRGPWGRYTLQVTLWDAHAKAARCGVVEGQYLFLRNMRIKLNKDQLYEGVLNGDKKFPDRVNVVIIENMEDSRVKAIEQREKEYNRRIANEERKLEDGEEDESEGRDDVAPPRNGNESEIQHILGDENDMVKCERPSMTFTSIREILERRLPKGRTYDNRKYHIVGKVIDFLPKKMEDFAKPVPVDDSDSDDVNDRNPKPEEWEWRFALLVEGRDGHQIQVIVSGKEAEYFLNLDAGDLWKDKKLLASLRRKLGILWGNVEIKYWQETCQPLRQLTEAQLPQAPGGKNKRKRNEGEGGSHKKKPRMEEPSPRSADSDHMTAEEEDDLGEAKFFQACLMEYGDSQGKRRFKIFGTTIMS